jgi:WD40 repeat protein
VRSLAFSPDDKRLAAGLEDKSIRLFDLESKAETARLNAHIGPVTHVLFHPDGKQFVSGSEKGELIHWDLSAQKPQGTKRVLGGIENLFWGAEDRALMVEDGRGRLLFIRDLDKPGLASALNEMDVPYERKFAYAKNTGQLAVVNTWGIRLLDMKTNREMDFLPEANVKAVEWAEDGRTLMVAAADVFGWDVVEQKEVYRISNAEINGGVTSLAKSPDGKIVAGGISNQKVCFWELRSGRLIREVSLARKIEAPGWWFITSVQFSADGRLLFPMARDMYFVLEVESGLIWFQKPNQDPADTSFALIGHHTLLSAEPQGTARLWSWAPESSPRTDQSSDRLWRGLTGHDGRTVYSAMFALANLKDDAVQFLDGQLSEIRNPSASPETIASLIEELDKADPDTRRNASEELRKLGSQARPQLEKALQNENLAARVRPRIQLLLVAQGRVAEPDLLAVRGVQILEWIGTRKAREALERLANDPSDHLGREAKAALRRLSPPTD